MVCLCFFFLSFSFHIPTPPVHRWFLVLRAIDLFRLATAASGSVSARVCVSRFDISQVKQAALWRCRFLCSPTSLIPYVHLLSRICSSGTQEVVDCANSDSRHVAQSTFVKSLRRPHHSVSVPRNPCSPLICQRTASSDEAQCAS